MCQYWVNMKRHLAGNPFLSLPVGLTNISWAIGLFYVHGHKDKCFARYDSTFIPSVGIVDGEIIKTLWEPLNHIAPSTRKVTPEHHREIIDDHMNNSNWKKMLWMGAVGWFVSNAVLAISPVDWICIKYPATIIEAKKVVAALASVEATSEREIWCRNGNDRRHKPKWTGMKTPALWTFMIWKYPMVYLYFRWQAGTDNVSAPSKADMELELLGQNVNPTITVILESLKLEEQQYVYIWLPYEPAHHM